MEKPIIAMPQMGNDLFRKYMKSKYVGSIERAGGAVRWIELENIDTAVKSASECDGLLLPGGADINPAMYNQPLTEKCGKPNPVRDCAEPKILEEFLKTGKPILAICRGIQLVNVYFGGTLYQDIKEIQKYKHSDFLHRKKGTHPLTVKKDTLLYDITGDTEITVNSMHHQAADKIGDGLVVSAKSADGFVEGLELADYGFFVAVQWHPEHMSAGDRVQQRLFDRFVAETLKNK